MLMAQVRSSEEGGYVHMSEPVDVSNRYHQENGLLRWTYKEFLNKGERLLGSPYDSYINYIRRPFDLLAQLRSVTSLPPDQLQNKTAQYKPELWCGQVLIHDGRPIATIHSMGLAVPKNKLHRLFPATFLPEAGILMNKHAESV